MIFSSFTLPSATSLIELSDRYSYFKSLALGWTCRIPVLMIPKAETEVYSYHSASAGFYADLTHVH